MSIGAKQARGEALQSRILEVVRQEFEDLEPEVVRQALQKTLEELHHRVGGAPDQRAEQPLSGDMQRPFRPRRLTRAGRPFLVVLVETPQETRRALYQILQLGALLLEKSVLPGINEFFDMRLSLPRLHLSLEVQGRVVHLAGPNGAVELSGLRREDRMALEQAFEDLQGGARLRPEPVDVPTSELPMAEAEPLVEITDADPDIVEVAGPVPQLSSRKTTASIGAAGELYGPGPLWLEPVGEPERVETLGEERIVDILLQLGGHDFTGLMELRLASPDEGRQLIFDSGFLVEIGHRPRRSVEELGPLLLLADKVTEEQLAMAAAHADEAEISLARALLELQVLDAEPLRHAIAGRLTFLLREVKGVREGEVRIWPEEALPPGFLPQPPLRVHVAVERSIYRQQFETFRALPHRDREERVAGDLDTYPEVVAEERERLPRAIGEDEQLALVRRVITGRKRLREVFTESPMGAAETFAILYALHRMGLLRFDRSLHQTVVRERFRENVTVKYLSVHKASFFEVLNVHWSSYDEIVEQAYQELIQQFDPASVPAEMEEEVHQRVCEIRERVESAHQILSRRDHRHAYRKRIMPEYKLAHAIPLFLRQAELAERRQSWGDAVDALRRVLEIEPGHESAGERLAHVERLRGGLGEMSDL